MPYTTRMDREATVQEGPGDAPGDLTYLLYCLVVAWAHGKGGKQFSYTRASAAVGVLETCKHEFMRRFLDPYEDRKATANGDVSIDEARQVCERLFPGALGEDPNTDERAEEG